MHFCDRGMHARLPRAEDLAGLLQKCRQSKDLHQAMCLHAYLCEHQLESDPTLSNHLVPLLADCGSLLDAHHTFDRLAARNEHSWTSLISAYLDSDDLEHAFQLYHMMAHDSLTRPNRCTYLALLNACSRLRDADRGLEVHHEITQQGLEKDLFTGSPLVGNSLVDLYGKCGLLAEAHHAFDSLPIQNTVSWNALISGYAEHGLAKEVEICFYEMQHKGIAPSFITFLCSLKACSSASRDSETGQVLHAEIVKRGLEADLCVASTLVDTHIKCRRLLDARHAFDRISAKDAVLWASLISGYAENGLGEEAGVCFQQMHLQGTLPNPAAYVCTLKACASGMDVERGFEIHDESIRRGLERQLYMGNALVDLYMKCGYLGEARKVFDQLLFRDAVTWNALIAGYAQHNLDDEMLNCLKEMQLEGVSADAVTFAVCLKACSMTGALELGRMIHAEIKKSGLERDCYVGSILVDMYGKCGSIAEGCEVFDNLHVQDVVSWNAMINAYGENHEVNMAIECFEKMQQQGVQPNAVTFTCLLAACSHACLVCKGREYFKAMTEQHRIKPNVDHIACMVDLFARSGNVHEAVKFIAASQCPSSRVILTPLLTACKVYGKVELGQLCFQQLVEANQENASAYLLMADIYVTVGRWNDANRLEELRNNVGANKKLGIASVELNKRLQEYVVGTNKSKDTVKLSESLGLHMKSEGYVPNLDVLFGHVLIEEKELPYVEFVQENYLCLTGHETTCLSNKTGHRCHIMDHDRKRCSQT